MDGVSPFFTDFVRNFGVIFDEYLNFVEYINLLVRDHNYRMKNIGAVRRYLDSRCVVSILHSHVLPRIDFYS